MTVVRDRRVWIAAGAAVMLVLISAVAFGSSRAETSPTLPQVVTPRPLRATTVAVPTLRPASKATTAVPTRSGVPTPVPVPVEPKTQPRHAPSRPAPVEKPKPQAKPKAPARQTPDREVVTPYVREQDEESRRPVSTPVTSMSRGEHRSTADQYSAGDGGQRHAPDSKASSGGASEQRVRGSHGDTKAHATDARPRHAEQRAARRGRS